MTFASLALLACGGALIGFLLSLLGAGGSILLLPLLVSGAALPTKEAVPFKLAPHLSDRRLRQAFAALLLGSALLTGAEAVKRHNQGLTSPGGIGPASLLPAATRPPRPHRGSQP